MAVAESKPGGVTPITSSSTTPVSSLGGTRFHTVAEVASTLRVSKMSVYRLIHAGELEAVRFGRSFRVPEPALDNYLREAYFQTG